VAARSDIKGEVWSDRVGGGRGPIRAIELTSMPEICIQIGSNQDKRCRPFP
jgi:hypothetical protein